MDTSSVKRNIETRHLSIGRVEYSKLTDTDAVLQRVTIIAGAAVIRRWGWQIVAPEVRSTRTGGAAVEIWK